MNNKSNISIIGGAGHVGFALGLIFSSKGFNVSLIDKNRSNIKKINLLNCYGFAGLNWIKKNGLNKFRPFYKF